MAEFFTLEKKPNLDKKVRVVWETGDYVHDEASDDGWGLRLRDIEGIGEDGSQWIMPIEIDVNTEGWNQIDDVEMSSEPEFLKNIKLRLVDLQKRYVNSFWNEDGLLVYPDGLSKEVSVAEWFHEKLGDYPNIELSKGPASKKLEQILTDPESLLKYLLRNIPKDKISTGGLGERVQFYQTPKTIDGINQIMTVPTEYGLIKNILTVNNWEWQRKIKPDSVDHIKYKQVADKVLQYFF
jgi:hypothetical protein